MIDRIKTKQETYLGDVKPKFNLIALSFSIFYYFIVVK